MIFVIAQWDQVVLSLSKEAKRAGAIVAAIVEARSNEAYMGWVEFYGE